jgi:hypothetical protein
MGSTRLESAVVVDTSEREERRRRRRRQRFQTSLIAFLTPRSGDSTRKFVDKSMRISPVCWARLRFLPIAVVHMVNFFLTAHSRAWHSCQPRSPPTLDEEQAKYPTYRTNSEMYSDYPHLQIPNDCTKYPFHSSLSIILFISARYAAVTIHSMPYYLGPIADIPSKLYRLMPMRLIFIKRGCWPRYDSWAASEPL